MLSQDLHHSLVCTTSLRIDLDIQFSPGESFTGCVGTVALGVSLCKHPLETLWADGSPGSTLPAREPCRWSGGLKHTSICLLGFKIPPPALQQHEEVSRMDLQPHHPRGLFHPGKG